MSSINPSASTVDIESRLAAQNQLAGTSPGAAGAAQSGSAPGNSFAQTLLAAQQGITLSGHALTRLSSRQISLSESDYAKLGDAMSKASAKGARSSLVLMDRPDQTTVGLVVSVPNRTVITAVDTQGLKENIFTNIDSAMII
jgi:flagellar operon protein